MLLSFHKFPSPCGRTPAVSPAFPWLPPKFANPQIVAGTIKNRKKSAESTQKHSIQRISHPLSAAKKARCARVWGRERSGSGLAAVRSYHNFSTLDTRVLKLKVCSSKDVFLFTGRAYTHNCSEGNERKVNHAGCKSGSPE